MAAPVAKASGRRSVRICSHVGACKPEKIQVSMVWSVTSVSWPPAT